MRIIDWQDFLKNGLPLNGKRKQSSLTIGVFDGVHLGHQSLIRRIVSHNDKIPVVVTFREVPNIAPPAVNLQTFEEKSATLESLGVKILLAIDFTDSFKRLTGLEFLESLLSQSNTGFVAIGANFRCGFNLDTDADAIRRFFSCRNIPVEVIPEVMEASLPISSSRIRSALANRDVELARRMLGRELLPPMQKL
ncbi:MAG: FAD synthetase family protein [Treponema sp.]|jgi:cytidyltransferase-like protein|nr:FAD synthetase family protein [Treponema sp.]